MTTHSSDHRRDVGLYGPMREGSFLTIEELNALPDGAEVEVIWSGGNGPFVYTKQSDRWGRTLISSVHDDRPAEGEFVDLLGGSGSPLTKAKLVEFPGVQNPC